MRAGTKDVPVDAQQVDRVLVESAIGPVALQENDSLGIHVNLIRVRRDVIALLGVEIGAGNNGFAGFPEIHYCLANALELVGAGGV